MNKCHVCGTYSTKLLTTLTGTKVCEAHAEIRERYPKTLGVDFDGTICYSEEFPKVGEPKPNAVRVLRRLHDEGYRIIVWTNRSSIEHQAPMLDFLNSKAIPYDDVNYNHAMGAFPKPYCDIWIDDRNLGGIPDDWELIYLMIKKQLP